MPTFAFVARDDAGQTRRGSVDANSAALVATQLRTRGWIVVTLEEQLSATRSSSDRGEFLENLLRPRSIQVELSLIHI